MTEKSWELIKETEWKRFYKLNFKVKKTFSDWTLPEMYKHSRLYKYYRDKYELLEDIENEGIDKVCVSDALTHVERLVFPVVNVLNKETGEVELYYECFCIAGEHTFMIFGGDASLVYPDEVYLMQLKNLNSGGDNYERD